MQRTPFFETFSVQWILSPTRQLLTTTMKDHHLTVLSACTTSRDLETTSPTARTERERTQKKKSKKGGDTKTCTKCLKSFVRLDTHLKNSASCKYVSSLKSTLTEHQSPALNLPSSPRSEQDSHPQNISHSGNCVNQHLNQHPSHTFSSKASLLLPTTKEGWAKADEHFRDQLVPHILETISVDEKNRLLVNGIYEYLALHCGHRSSQNSEQFIYL